LTPWDIVAASYNLVGFADGTTASLTIQQAYGDAVSGAAAQRKYNGDYQQYLASNKLVDLRIRDFFALRGGTNAFTAVGGNVIYINPGTLNTGNANRNQALLMHELLHNEWGLDDGDILVALYGRGADKNRPSADITRWFERECIGGKGNN
jgi:hypothetical protein